MSSKTKIGFNSSEHAVIGDAVVLKGLDSNENILTLANGVQVTYGELIALAGDYYGVPENPICLGTTPTEQEKRFLAAYQTLATGSQHAIYNLLALIKFEYDSVQAAMKAGQTEYEAMKAIVGKETIEAIVYTGGRYITLAENNMDHFNDTACIAYHTGHGLAMQTAAQASQLENKTAQQQQLAYAYTLEGFANHFLTDHFAPGHIRTPRLALHKAYGSELGSLFSLFQHDEENFNGLLLENSQGENWYAYGDAELFEAKNNENKARAIAAVQLAVDEVYQSFQQGAEVVSKMNNYIPTASVNNYSPLFKVDSLNNTILYRENLSDPNSTTYEPISFFKIPIILGHFLEKYLNNEFQYNKISIVKQKYENAQKNELQCYSLFKAPKPADHRQEALTKPLPKSITASKQS